MLGAYTSFSSLKEAEEFANELSGENLKVLVTACACGCNLATVYSIYPGGQHPLRDETILHPGPYRKEFDLTYYFPEDYDKTQAAQTTS